MNYLKAWNCLRKRLDPTRYDLVHAQFGQAGLLPWPKRVPVVVTFHGCDILGDMNRDGRVTIAGRVLQGMCQLEAIAADGVIIVSNAMRRYLPRRVRPLVLPTGVDLDSLPTMPPQEARHILGLSQADRLVLFVGDPAVHGKRYSIAKAAVESVNLSFPVKLVVGSNRPHREILLHMRACDVLVVTSRQEGSPTIVKEALACSLPVVSVPVGDVPERIGGIEGCELCLDDNPGTIAAALERALTRGQRLSNALVNDLDEKVLADRLIRFYQSVIDRSGARSV
jgi:glycosyltransferase involved in cell wall biosynthesis